MDLQQMLTVSKVNFCIWRRGLQIYETYDLQHFRRQSSMLWIRNGRMKPLNIEHQMKPE
ncbi:hypothetical protein HOLleu_33194 [Holothuria leucospilota]|uniref:Uncharacterized protein n=1 Tax=Holothuria leucospilota TaxID=206669 RepID=A0A9Q0YNB7_HOLLE|nr:hypothetical protein HOLleu_33194 [Holothuria leucospilota]